MVGAWTRLALHGHVDPFLISKHCSNTTTCVVAPPPQKKKKEKEKISCLARIPVTALWLHPALLATLTTTCDFFLVNTPHCVHETATSRRAALLLVCLSKSEHCTNRCGSASRSPIYIFFYPGAIIMLPRGLAGLAVGRHGSLGRRGGTRSPS